MTFVDLGPKQTAVGAEVPHVQQVPRILAILPYPPNPLRPRTVSMISDLSSFAEIDLIYLDHGEILKLPSDARIRTIRVVPNKAISRLLRIALGCVQGKPISYQYYFSRELAQHLESYDLSEYAAIFVERIPLNELDLDHPNVILDIADCNSYQVRQCADLWPGLRRYLYKFDALRIQKYEANLCNRATKLMCTADRELQGFRSIGVKIPIAAVTHASNAVPRKRVKPRRGGKKLLTFHGKLSYIANQLALARISNEIVTGLNAAEYDVVVAGAGGDKLSRAFPNIRFLGYVDDISEFLGSGDLGVFPVEISAGLSNKVIECLATGVPVVVTPQLAAGLPDSDELLKTGIIVSEVGGFCDAIQSHFELPEELRDKIGDQCVEYVRRIQQPERRRNFIRDFVFSIGTGGCDEGHQGSTGYFRNATRAES